MEQAKIPDRYTLIEEVGQGGMAIVYRATDETLKREVAIKVLHQHLAAEPESKARLEREAQAVAKLRHENILEIFDYSGLDSQSSYIVTEFIDGQTLKQFLAGRTLRHPEVAALVALEVCGALAHAHSVGILHRDVKPENVMVRKDGLLKLMDFGIAQMLDLQRMTVTGQLLGSPAYMAPEIVEGKQLDFRTDVFSVGIMLYLLATGSLPFTGKNPHEVLRRITEGKFTDPRMVGRGVDQALSRIITRALARRPEDRYPDVGLLADDLRAYLTDAGLGDVRAELRAFFADPDAYEAALPKRLAAALTAAAHAPPVGEALGEGAGALEPRARLRSQQRRGGGGAAPAGGPRAPEAGGGPRVRRRRCSPGELARREEARAAERASGRAQRPVGPSADRRRAGAPRRPPRPPSRRRSCRVPPPAAVEPPPAAATKRHGRRPRGRARRARRRFRPPPPLPARAGRHAHVHARADAPERRRLPRRPAPVRLRRRPHQDLRPLGGRALHRVPQPLQLLLPRARSRSGPSSRCPPIRSSRAGSSGGRRTWW